MKSLKGIQRTSYIRSFVEFVDITKGLSSFGEKEEAATLLIKAMNIKQDQFKTRTKWKHLEISLRYIYQEYKANLPNFFE